MVEQLLLRLRRAGLVESRRGRHGGYRLALPARQIVLTEVLAAAAAAPTSGMGTQHDGDNKPSDQVTAALEKRLERSISQVLAQLTLEDLLFDLRSAAASLDDDGGLMLG
jgi:Rrf2 family protein